MAAFICLWFFISRHPCRIVTTSVDGPQLEGVLWGEIRRFIQTAQHPLDSTKGGALLVNHLHIRKFNEDGELCGLSYLIGRVAKRGEGMLGHHISDVGDGVPRTLYVADEACYDDQTEILTDRGWKHFADLMGDEKVLTMDPATRVAEYRQPTALIERYHCGKMYLYERRCGNFCVTPNHRMLWKRERAGCAIPYSEYYLQPISEINGTGRHIPRCFIWKGDNPRTLEIPYFRGARKAWDKRSVPSAIWLEFLGWYLAEGNLTFQNGIPYGIHISQKDPGVRAHITQLARQLGFTARDLANCMSPGVRINERRIAEYMLSHGRYAWEKRVPSFIFTLAPELIESFLQAFKFGDGYDKGGGREIYYTSSPYLADAIQILSFKAGRESTIRMRRLIGLPAPNGFSRRDGYVVGRSRPRLDSHLKIKRQHLRLVDYCGYVYCVRVPPYHTVFVRRGGDCMWCGNSGLEDISFERAGTWAKRKLVIGNPYPTGGNFFEKGVEGGDIPAVA